MALNWSKTKSSFILKQQKGHMIWRKKYFYKHAGRELKHIKIKSTEKNLTHPLLLLLFHFSFVSYSLTVCARFSFLFRSPWPDTADSHCTHIFDPGFFVLFRLLEHETKSVLSIRWMVHTHELRKQAKLDIYFIFMDFFFFRFNFSRFFSCARFSVNFT